MDDDRQTSEPSPSEPTRERAVLPDEGAMVDEHGRAAGVPSRTGTGSSSPQADPERVRRAASQPKEPRDERPR
ncbi:hypothetical protein ACWGHM_40545 [Streptomyces sp. NPDC054904]